MRSEEISNHTFLLQLGVLLLCFHDSYCVLNADCTVYCDLLVVKTNALSPEVNPKDPPQPFVPLLAPSPLLPFTNYSHLPPLSGLCSFNFSAVGTLLRTTAVDCWDPLAPYLANVVCCPQFHAAIETLVGQSSIYTRKLSLNVTHASHCLSDIEQILESQGANRNLRKICSIHQSNLTQASCPTINVNEIERILNFTKLAAACKDIDPVNECCTQVCQNAISDAAEKIGIDNQDNDSLNGIIFLAERSSIIDDCRSIVVRWLASKFDLSSSILFQRRLSQCTINNVCPLVFPDIKIVTQKCGYAKSNHTPCCEAMKSYMSRLQDQSFVTNLQASNCAALLAQKLQTANISQNIYTLCHINLKDFSLQVGSQDSGCLFPSMSTDVKYDQNTGISFVCDLNDNVEASWPSPSSIPVSLCNRTTRIPALPKATSAQNGHYIKGNKYLSFVMFSCFLLLKLIV